MLKFEGNWSTRIKPRSGKAWMNYINAQLVKMHHLYCPAWFLCCRTDRTYKSDRCALFMRRYLSSERDGWRNIQTKLKWYRQPEPDQDLVRLSVKLRNVKQTFSRHSEALHEKVSDFITAGDAFLFSDHIFWLKCPSGAENRREKNTSESSGEESD